MSISTSVATAIQTGVCRSALIASSADCAGSGNSQGIEHQL
jgi:hypothetical protein